MAAVFVSAYMSNRTSIMRTKLISATNNEVIPSQLSKILNQEVSSVSNILGAKIKVLHVIVYSNLIVSLLLTMMLVEYSLLLAGASLAYAAMSLAILKMHPIKGLID